MEQNLEHFPPPPPWRRQKLGDKITYINDISGEETETHPLTSYFTQAAALQDEDSLSNHMTHLPEEDISVSTEDQMMIFRCEWKEVGLLGHVLSYGMNLCYYRNDHHFEITFDGVRACWRFSRLDGPYGPLDEDDLFIGSKITVFDRHLTISSANSHICQMIDHKGQLLRKRISWLQSKLESIGAVPVVKRESKAPEKHIIRSSKAFGTDNLRRLQIEISKLCEQMGSLGIGHLVAKLPK